MFLFLYNNNTIIGFCVVEYTIQALSINKGKKYKTSFLYKMPKQSCLANGAGRVIVRIYDNSRFDTEYFFSNVKLAKNFIREYDRMECQL